MNISKVFAIAIVSMASLCAANGNGKAAGKRAKNGCDAVENMYGSMGCEMATGRPQVEPCGCNNWYITAGAIYWHARVDGTEFAYSNELRDDGLPVRGSMKDVHYSWDWGFRVGLGYVFNHDDWDTNLEFTYFDSSGSKNSSAGCNDIMNQNRAEFGIFNGDQLGGFLSARVAKAKSDIDYYNLDWELGRAQFNTRYLYIRTHFGFKGTWTDLTQTTRFSDLYSEDTGGVGSLDCDFVHVKDLQSWWGVGPRIGFDTKWFLNDNFNLFCDASFAALFGLFDVKRRVKYSGNPDHTIRVRANKHALTPYAQILIGAAYDWYVDDTKGSHVLVRVGYEVNYLWRQNQLLRVDDSLANAQKYERHSEDVSFNGITAEVKWEF